MKEKKQLPAYRYWCSTIFPKHEGDPEKLREYAAYLVYQKEVCPKTGQDHWQLYVEFKKPLRMTAIVKICNGNWATRIAKHAIDAAVYCMKEDTRKEGHSPFEYGVRPQEKQPGSRTDLLGCQDILDAGGSIADCFQSHFGTTVRYNKGLQLYQALCGKKRNPLTDDPMDVQVFWGPTMSGKSTEAYRLLPDAYRQKGNKWWDFYDGQDAVVIDDFMGAMPITDFLTAFDKFPNPQEKKGSMCHPTFTKAILTSNLHPRDWYPDAAPEHVNALLRRLKIKYFPHVQDGFQKEDVSSQDISQEITCIYQAD